MLGWLAGWAPPPRAFGPIDVDAAGYCYTRRRSSAQSIFHLSLGRRRARTLISCRDVIRYEHKLSRLSNYLWLIDCAARSTCDAAVRNESRPDRPPATPPVGAARPQSGGGLDQAPSRGRRSPFRRRRWRSAWRGEWPDDVTLTSILLATVRQHRHFCVSLPPLSLLHFLYHRFISSRLDVPVFDRLMTSTLDVRPRTVSLCCVTLRNTGHSRWNSCRKAPKNRPNGSTVRTECRDVSREKLDKNI